MTERLPFVIRPITYDIPEADQKGYSRREEREIGGVKYYFYYMDDDKAFTNYMEALTKIGKVEDFEITQSLRPRLNLSRARGDFAAFREFFKCKCQVCTGPDQFETFCLVKDYKVVEGVRQVKCRGLIQTLVDNRMDPNDYFGQWTNFGENIPHPEFPSFLDIAKNGVRMKDRPMAIPGRRGMSFFQHPCDALEDLLPVLGESCLATVTDAKTGVTQSLDAALEQVRHKGESYPSPFLTHVYTVNPDE